MSQSIDFANVTDATFNGGTVDIVNLNGTEIWAGSSFVQATGGSQILTQGNYKIHIFNSTGTFSTTNGGEIKEILIVGGGGAGHKYGGGGGGFFTTSSFSVSSGALSVVVGLGGLAELNTVQPLPCGTGNAPISDLAGSGGSSSFFSYSANGGDGGNSGFNNQPLFGAYSGDGIIGNAGSYHAQGGGGGAGGSGNILAAGFSEGGPGLNSSITGLTVGYAGGGGGATFDGHNSTTSHGGGKGGARWGECNSHNGAKGTQQGGQYHNDTFGVYGPQYNQMASTCGNGINMNPTSGTPNTGGGGGADWGTYCSDWMPGNGGSGVVIIKYQFQ
jgi:hypothetical protein